MAKSKALTDLVQSAIDRIKSTKKYEVFPQPKSSFGKNYDDLAAKQYTEESMPYMEDVYPEGKTYFDAIFEDLTPIGQRQVSPDINPYEFIDSLNFKVDPLLENAGNFVQKENIDNIYDMYVRGMSTSAILKQLPKKYRDGKAFNEDFGSGNIETEFNHIFSQTYKDDLARKLGVETYMLHVDPKISNNIDFPYVTDIQSGSVREFDGIVNPGEVVTIPKKMIADEFYQNPNKLLSSVREFQGFVDKSNAAEYDDLIGSLRSLNDPPPAPPKPKKPNLSVVKNNLNSMAIGGGGILGSALLSPEDAVAQSIGENPYSAAPTPGEMLAGGYSLPSIGAPKAPVLESLANGLQGINDWREENIPAPINFFLPGQGDADYIRNRAYGREPSTWEKIKFGLSFL